MIKKPKIAPFALALHYQSAALKEFLKRNRIEISLGCCTLSRWNYSQSIPEKRQE